MDYTDLFVDSALDMYRYISVWLAVACSKVNDIKCPEISDELAASRKEVIYPIKLILFISLSIPMLGAD